MEIGERIRYFRKDVQHMTQVDFAQKINVTRANIASIETGRISVTDRVISDICTTFSVSEEWLRTGTGDMMKETDETLFTSFARRYDLSQEEQAVARYLLSLSSAERQHILHYVLKVADAVRGNVPDSGTPEKDAQQKAPPASGTPPDETPPAAGAAMFLDADSQAELDAYAQELAAEQKARSASASTNGASAATSANDA